MFCKAAQVALMTPVVGYEYTPAGHLLVTDEDAADFLQSQFSNELRPFEYGRCTYGLWLDLKGKVIADSVIFCEGGERFRIMSEYSNSTTIAQKLDQHIIADDVVIDHMPLGGAIALIGMGAIAILDALGYLIPESATFVHQDGVRVSCGRRSQEVSFELWSDSAAKLADLKVRLVQMGVMFASYERVQIIRIAAGVPSVPVEIGPQDLPGEGGLVGDGVSLTKGCFLGQEVVARMHNVGRSQRALFSVSGSGTPPVCPIVVYNSDSKKIGELRSAFSVDHGWQGVALLKDRYANIGEMFKHDSGSAKIDGRLRVMPGEAK
jgi:folate-binding protein YgfZ